MKRKSIALGALAGVVALAAAACGETTKTAAEKPAPSALTAAATLRTTLDGLLREHVYLAALATGNALAGQTAAFNAAKDAVDANSVALSKAVGSVYGSDAEAAFLPLWRSHIGFVVDYTTGVATKDKAKQDKAVADLIAYTETFGAFINKATPALPKAAVADLVKMHITTLKDVVDAQAAKDYGKADTGLREAAEHMGMISSALADAIVKQFPAKFA